MIKDMLIAGAGGFVGTAGRYLVGRLASGFWHGAFPMGTFLVNLAGCFLIGLFFGLMERLQLMSPHHNLLLVTGFCGGFTTFSAFANEMWTLADRGQWGVLSIYLTLSIVLGVALVWAGRAMARWSVIP